MKTPTLAFFSQRNRHDEHGDRDNFKSRERPLVTHMLPQHELHGIGRCGDQNSELIRETRDEAARFIRRQLAQMNGNHAHAPCTPACIRKEPIARTMSEVPNAQNGITSNARDIAAIIVTLLPSFSENCPNTIAPTIAPIL